MSLPESIHVAAETEGLSFELRVSALPRGCACLFPERGAADVFRSHPDLRGAVVREAASALDAAISRFLPGFEASLCGVLAEGLDAMAGKQPAEASREAFEARLERVEKSVARLSVDGDALSLRVDESPSLP